MSSGEKELFCVFVNLFRIKDLPSIILYDEPERHLNAGLETRIIPALDKLQTRNQIWIASHGIELIGSVPMTDIVALKRTAGSASPERFDQESKTRRVRIFEEIGAKVGLQLASNRIVFLEGKESHADKRIIDRLAGPHLPGVLFVASGSSKGVMGAATRAGTMLDKASSDAAFFMVLDRDYRADDSVASLARKLEGKVMIWGCHEVENLLLHAPTILEILKNCGVDALRTAEMVTAELQAAAKALEDRFVTQWAAYRLHARLSPADDEKDPRPLDEAGLLRMSEAGKRSAVPVTTSRSTGRRAPRSLGRCRSRRRARMGP